MRDSAEPHTAIADPMLPIAMRVSEAWRELDDVVSLRLVTKDGAPFAFAPGQFNMLYAFGVGEAAISISGDPARTGELLHTIRDVGAVSGALTRLKAGDEVGVRGPFGSSWPVDSEHDRHLLFVAGGLGLAPLRPAIYRALATRHRFASITLIMGARSPRDLLYPYQLAGWTASHALRLNITVDHAGPEWTGSVGVVTTEFARALAGIDPAKVSAYLCGPEIMMRFGAMGLADRGVSTERMWLSMERSMKCAIGLCGHCQFGPDFVCKDGPVFRHDEIARRLTLKEI